MTEKQNIAGTADIIIVGGGVAGLTAGIYAGRGGQKTVIFEGNFNSSVDLPGGQLMLTPEIENFPGYNGTGWDLIEKIREQAENHVEEIFTENIERFTFGNAGELHQVHVENGEVWEAKAVILATGAVARRLNIEGEDRLYGKGVSSCATCDGSFFKDQTVAVVGGGDTAVEDALYLADIAKKVYLIHRRDTLRTDSPESRALAAKENVQFLWNTKVLSVEGEDKVASATLASTVAEVVSGNVQATGEATLPLDGLFVAIGHDPASKLVHGHPVEVENTGYILAKETETNVPGLFVAGDVADSKYRQAITAAATGAQAAMNAIKYSKVS